MPLGAYLRDVDDAAFLLRRCVIRPGQLRVVLANRVFVRFQTEKGKPNPKRIGRYGRFGPILGPVFFGS